MKKNKPGFFKDFFGTIREGVRDVSLKSSLTRDMRAIYEFYLSQKERQELQDMRWFRRWLFRSFWFFKSIFLKLTPFRRILLLLSVILLADIGTVSRMFGGYVILFIVLLLELKDKLLAHDELRAGRAVQAALRPDKCPDIAGWDAYIYSRSANEVGGDLVDCLHLFEDHFAFMIGDVSGKGLGAALLMAQLQASVHALAPSTKSIAKLVTQLNDLYCRGGLSNSFISFIYFEIKENDGKINFVNAGHLPPLVKKNVIQEWSKGGIALGLEPRARYKEQKMTLARDEFVVLYTDGIPEARNAAGEFFGESRFVALLSSLNGLDARGMGTRIVDSIDKFIGQTPRSDDVTFLILKRTNDGV